MNKTFFRSLAQIAAVAASMIVGAKIPYELLSTPGTFQTFFLCLTAIYLHPREVLLGQLFYLVLGFFLPVFSSDFYGMQVFLGSSTGYLLAFPVAAFVLAYLSKKNNGDWFLVLSQCILAHAIVLTGGFLWIWLRGIMDPLSAADFAIIFLLPGAFMKSALATVIFLVAERFLKKKQDV